ncbi:uncharacterized protein [Diabrotica undecimpunctata]|uniref:uncharacterized protein n=1 Tax=Diabrotica undecimpunctata TaxID=50387 RepID=UPI003B640691
MQKLVAIIVICCALKFAWSWSNVACGDTLDPGDLVYQKDVREGIFQSVTLRAPETGEYERNISCVMALDFGGSNTMPRFSEGGPDYRYVVINLRPDLMESLNYSVKVYIERAHAEDAE